MTPVEISDMYLKVSNPFYVNIPVAYKIQL